MAQIRERFATKLDLKIADTNSALPEVASEGASGTEAVAAAYRRIHDICGIAPTVGFVETGRVARTLDEILIGPFRAARALTADEMARLRTGLEALQAAARIDATSIDTAPEQRP